MKRGESHPKRVRYHAEIFDKMQYLFQEFNDHQVHAVIYFAGTIDRELFEKAIRRSVGIVPILGCRFVLDKAEPFWEQADEACLDRLLSFTDIGDRPPDDEIHRFITGRTDEKTGPQVMARIVRASGRDTLCVVMNHMVCDGAGFKEYLYRLSEIYTRLQDGTFGDFQCPNGSRSERQIYRNFTFSEKIKAFFMRNEATKSKNTVCFPMSREPSGHRPFIRTHTFSAEKFERLKSYGKIHAVTINDIVLAAFFRALNRMLDEEQREALTIPCMVDLRRYLPGKSADGICNLASMVSCHIGPTTGESFDETVSRVHAAMDRRKSGYPGLNGLSALKILDKLPFWLTYRLLRKHYANPLIGITNIGIIDSRRLAFGKVPIRDAYIAASIKYPPYFQLGLTTYRNSVTFTVNQYGLESDKEIIRQFFSLLDEELSFGNKY